MNCIRKARKVKKKNARFITNRQHAARQHQEKVAKIVHLLFVDTPDNAQLVHVKKTAFNEDNAGGAPIIEREHPAIKALLSLAVPDSLPEGVHLI